MGRWKISVAKEYLKFSSAHFTIFSDADLEKLHGHNYYTSVDLEIRESASDLLIDFHTLKRMMRRICESLDERILLPMDSPNLKISKHEDQFHVVFTGSGFKKAYEFPCEDTVLLPVRNISSEALSRHICGELMQNLNEEAAELIENIMSVTVTVEETRGQSVSYIWEN